MHRQDKATTERHARTLRELVKQPENKVCADCKRNDPRWASWNIGVFLCIRCSGIHRGMGTHISKVKSVDLDVWTPEQMESIQKWGNQRANLYWEAHLKQGHIPPDHKLESFIRSKYESRRWAKEGPAPSDPSVLEGGSSTEPPPPSQEQSPAASKPLVSSNSISSQRTSGFTAQQPQAHQLLSSNFIKTPSAPATKQPAAQPVQSPPPPQDDLFSLDFHAPPVTSSNVASQQSKKDMKQDILSLYSPAPANAPITNNPMNQFGSALWNPPSQIQQQQPAQSISMIGDTGIGAWGTSSGWTSSPPAQPNIWSTPVAAGMSAQQASLFNTTDVWGNSPATASNTGFTSNRAPQKKDDAFGDIWGSFK